MLRKKLDADSGRDGPGGDGVGKSRLASLAWVSPSRDLASRSETHAWELEGLMQLVVTAAGDLLLLMLLGASPNLIPLTGNAL